MATETATSYDLVPYESSSFPQTHPDRLATIATLLGLRPASAKRCRVLELGCAAGGNLIPLAFVFPESSFLGIDLSKTQITDGQPAIRALGIQNIELRAESILDFSARPEKYDFILCHGVYSWVPKDVREKILEVCKSCLAPQGVAYVSYNTYPGWHMRGMVRDMLRFHAEQFTLPTMKVKQARYLLDFLANSVEKEGSPFSLMLKGEVAAFQQFTDSHLFHEHLEEVNDPVYFFEFAKQAAAKGLKYFADANLNVMLPANFPPAVANVLQKLSQDHIHLEQYMDFLRNRTFRRSLLCHGNLFPQQRLRAEQMKQFRVATPARPKNEKPVLDDTSPEEFAVSAGPKVTVREPLVKMAMALLSEAWPKAMPFLDVLREARQRLNPGKTASGLADQADIEILGQAFLAFYTGASNLLELWLDYPDFHAAVSEKPTASSLARYQASKSGKATNCRHETVFLGEFERRLIELLDGTNDQTALEAKMFPLISKGDLTVKKNGKSVTDEAEIKQILAESIKTQISFFANRALLTA